MNPASQTRKNLKYCSTDGICAMPWFLLSLPGSFIAAGLLNSLFAIGPFWFGVVAAMPAVANAIHILIVPFFARFMQVRDMVISFGWLNLAHGSAAWSASLFYRSTSQTGQGSSSRSSTASSRSAPP